MTADATALASLNAIKLSAREVAATFVAPPAFETLLHADNAILTGPRGSGKTTMLKMMQSEALEHWTAEAAESARENVLSVGVFIGADRTWNEQLAMHGNDLPAAVRESLTMAAFTTHGIRAIVEAMNYRLHGPVADLSRVHRRVDPAQFDEAAMGDAIANYLDLPRSPSTLPTVQNLLSDRMVEIGTLRNRLRRDPSVKLPAWVDLDFLAVAEAVVERFNQLAGEADQKWALLFDELELAPKRIVEILLGALRGHQPRLLFKLSLAPANDQFDALDHEHAPVPAQDYEHVPLTYARKRPALRFAKTFVHASLERNSRISVPPVERFLGNGDLDSREEFEADASMTPTRAYEVGSRLWRTMDALKRRDETFAEYLRTNGIDLEQLESLEPAKRAARLRKIRNIVVVREYFRGEDGRRRSRKSFGLYTGADSILSLPDGNPRMIISLVRQLFPTLDVSAGAKVKTSTQSAAIEATLFRFLSLLEAQQAELIDSHSVSLMELADHIGQHLAEKLVEAPFNDNVALSFRMSADVRSEVRTLFTRGINAGAFIHVPPRHGGDKLSGEIVGRQFRLSHLLATKYGLPIHLTPATALGTMLPASWTTQPKSTTALPGSNLTLFDQ